MRRFGLHIRASLHKTELNSHFIFRWEPPKISHMRQVNDSGFDRRALIVPALTLFMKACAAVPAAAVPSSAHPHLRKRVPSFETQTLDGRQVATAHFAGHVWLVDFFAAYCAPCHERFAVLSALEDEVRVVGISVDDDRESAAAQVRRFGLRFSVIHDAARALAGRFRVTTLPMTFLIDRSHCVTWVADSRLKLEHFTAGVRQNIAEAKAKST